MLTLSYTKLELLHACPFAFEQRYLRGLILPPQGYLFLGGTIHLSLAKNFTHKMEKLIDMDLGDLLDHFSTVFDSRKAIAEDTEEGYLDIDWGEDKPGDLKDCGTELLKVYHLRVAPQVTPLAVEISLERKIPNTSTLFRGRVDNIEASGKLIDYKTTKRKYSQFEVAQSLQPTAMAFLSGGETMFEFHLLLKHKVPSVAVMKTERSQADIDFYLRMIQQDMRMIQAGIFPPRVSWRCDGYCGYRQLCGFPAREFII